MSKLNSQQIPSLSFSRAVEKFTSSLPAKQKVDFANAKLEDVYDAIQRIQQRRGHEDKLRNMARIQSFLDAMVQYRKVMEPFQNCTPFLGFVWGSIKFILVIADTWVRSLDIILEAYKEIGERLPSFIKYQNLFERDLELRKALEFYFCDILEFHFHAIKFLNRPKWRELFDSSWKTFDTQFKRILDSLARHKSLIESEKGTLTLLEAQKAREIVEFQSNEIACREESRKLKDLMERLAPTDFSRDQYEASEQRRVGNTGKWLLKNEDFQRWLDLDDNCNPLLYINGIPGSGKTVLSSFLIERLLKEGNAPVLYFFCKYNRPGKNRYTDVLSALAAQFAQQDKALAGYMYDTCITKDRLGILEVLETLTETAFKSQTSCFVVIDGLDECQTDEAEKIIFWLVSRQKESESAGPCGIRLLFVGQRTSILTKVLAPAVSISLDIPEHHADIRHYVEDLASKIQEEFGLDDFVRSQIITRVTGIAKSMFLYARLVMENLQNQVTQKEVLRELEPAIFPVDLDNAYQRICETVFKEGPQKTIVLKIIGYIICAARSLKWREVQAAFYLDPKQNACDYAGCRLRKSCKQLCGSLVDLRKDSDDPDSEAVLELVHETARNHLIRKGFVEVSLYHLELTNFCLDYLLSSPLALSASDEEVKNLAQNGYYAFHDYASIHWFDHLSNLTKDCVIENHDWLADLSSRCRSFLESFDISNHAKFSSEIPSFGQIRTFIDSIPTRTRDRNLHYDVEWRTLRIRSAIEGLCDGDQDGDQDGDKAYQLTLDIYGVRPFKCRQVDCRYYFEGFSTRSVRDHHNGLHDRPYKCTQSECPFQSFGFDTRDGLERHMKINHSTTQDDSPNFPAPPRKLNDDLCKAAARGDIVTVKGLLDRGSHVDQKSRINGGYTPLILAARNSHVKVAKLLLQHGADVNFQGPGGSSQTTALHSVVENNAIEILQDLLATPNVIPDKRDKNGLTPLFIACRNGFTTAAKLLLESKKVDANFGSPEKGYILSVSPWSNDLMELLMSQLSTLSTSHMLFGSHFVRDMDPKFFKLVLPYLKDNDWSKNFHHKGGMLHIAIVNNAWGMAKYLVNSGRIDLEMEDEFGDRALHYLVRTNYNHTQKEIQQEPEGIFKVILELDNCRPDCVNLRGETPLCLAAARGQTAVVKLLLNTGKVDVNRAEKGFTALSEAFMNDQSEVIKLLLETGKADVMARDSEGKTIISRAIENRHSKKVEWLLNASRADPDTGQAVIRIPPDEVEKLHTIVKYHQNQKFDALQDYQNQMILLEQQNKKRLLMARQEQDQINPKRSSTES